MTDRELLEAAASAAGIAIGEWSEYWQSFQRTDFASIAANWNPLVNDGDAFRLAVTLRMGVHFEEQYVDGREIEIVEVYYAHDDGGGCQCETQSLGDDHFAAMRRAIVRAAAEIGRINANN